MVTPGIETAGKSPQIHFCRRDLRRFRRFWLVDANGKTVSLKKYGTLSDNKACLDAVSTFFVAANAVVKPVVSEAVVVSNEEKNILGCGTIDTSGGRGGGPSGNLFGGLLIYFILNLLSMLGTDWRNRWPRVSK